MRLVLAISILAASATAAQAAEDRYGPPPVAVTAVAAVATAGYGLPGARPSAAAPAPYAGRMLGWSGKVAPPAAPVFAPAPAVSAAPMTQPTPQPIVAASATPQRGVQPSLYPSTYRAMPTGGGRTATPQAPLPTSLYDRPAAAAAPAPQPAPAYQPPAPQAQPQLQASAPLPPSPSAPSAPAPTSTAKAGWSPPKYYSVHRQFGETPDRIQIPPPTSYWVDRAGVAPDPATAGAASAPDDYPVGGVGNEPEEERPIKERIRTTNADGTVTTTTKRAAR